MTNSINGLDGAQELLIKLVEQNPEDWATRKKVVSVLYDAGFYRDASKMVWSAPEIPPVGEEVIFAARIVSKGQPSRAMRLFDTVIEKNMAHPEENLAMAKLLIKAAMPHQAIRFYGAATVVDTNLIDENFELSLVGADAESKDWSKYVATDDFPWDGPEKLTVEQEEAKKADPYAELLNGATQPVPMKAPVREKVERRTELPNWKIEKKKTSFLSRELLEEEPKKTELPKAQDSLEVKKVSPIEADSQEAIGNEFAEFLAGKKESEVKPVAPVTEEPVAKIDPKPAEVEPIVEPEPAEVNKVAEEPKKPVVDTLAVETNGTFFKNYDEAHEHKQEVEAELIKGAPAVPSVARATETKPAVEASEETLPKVEELEKETPSSVVEHVSDAMVQMDESDSDDVAESNNQMEGIKGRMAGAFSSLMSKMRRKPSTENDREPVINVDDLDLSGVEAVNSDETNKKEELKSDALTSDGAQKSQPESTPASQIPTSLLDSEPESVSKEVVTDVSEAVVSNIRAPKPISQHPVAAKKAESDSPSVPKELDGRTQLVSLAPEDGVCFFNQLQERYNNVGADLPRPAVLARDMANVDYLGLIKKACGKDLDSFSKLLGLHRVMSNAQCGEWVEDMNLLRKGYGDAVLATVVSKYSVTECREILNSVYSTPAPQAAAV